MHTGWSSNLKRVRIDPKSSKRKCYQGKRVRYPQSGMSIDIVLWQSLGIDRFMRALIKSGSPEDKGTLESLHREYMVYRKPRIASSTHIRSIIDIVCDHQKPDSDKPSCLVLDWLDCTLADLPYKDHCNNYVLLSSIVRAGLLSLAALHEEGLVHTGMQHMLVPFHVFTEADCKPANILLSNVSTEYPTIKLGDLGSGKSRIFRAN